MKWINVCLRTGEVVMKADPGQKVVEGHVDAFQFDRAALQVPRFQQLCKCIASQSNNHKAINSHYDKKLNSAFFPKPLIFIDHDV